MPDEPEPPEVEDLIRYDVLAQEALRSVVRKVLQEVARTGLPGEHHFYITFDTHYSGVRMSNRMRERYPDEMTIVVQHQFWDLETTDNGFSLGLSFDGIPESMNIPYSAIRGFFDPAVQFGLQFDTPEDDQDNSTEVEANEKPAGKLSPVPKMKKTAPVKPAKPAKEHEETGKGKPELTIAPTAGAADGSGDADSAQVVSLDSFRKK